MAAPFHFHKHLSDCVVCHPDRGNCSSQPVCMYSPGDSQMHLSFQLFCTSNLLQMYRPLVQHIFRMSNISRKSKMYFALFTSAFCLLHPSYKHGNEDMCHASCTLGASSMIMPGHHKLQCRVSRFHLENISHQEKKTSPEKPECLAASAILGIAIFYVESRDRMHCAVLPVWDSA